jgi:hypothetical protein
LGSFELQEWLLQACNTTYKCAKNPGMINSTGLSAVWDALEAVLTDRHHSGRILHSLLCNNFPLESGLVYWMEWALPAVNFMSTVSKNPVMLNRKGLCAVWDAFGAM